MERVVPLIIIMVMLLTGCNFGGSTVTSSFFASNYVSESKQEISERPSNDPAFSSNSDFLYEGLCFSDHDVSDSTDYEFSSYAAVCYDIDNCKILYSKNLFSKVYPASTTKLVTALLAVKYCSPDDLIYISEDNCGITTPGAQLCGFRKGDVVTVRDMLYCLLLYSGNDAGVALAEAIAGTEEDCVRKMNDLAVDLGCIGTYFMNTHGLHNTKHYTTPYDMYLIFNECLKEPELKEIFSCEGMNVTIKNELDGTVRELYMEPTNLYFSGSIYPPEGITIKGGKTGDTSSAGKCLVLYSVTEDGHGYITEIFKAPDKNLLYNETNELLKLCIPQSF